MNYVKIQKFTVFVKKSLEISILKIKNIIWLEIFVIIQVNREVQHIVDAIWSIVHLN